MHTGWISEGDGFLALDRNGDGRIDSGAELFGTAFRLPDGSTASDGFAALASLDSNADGVLDAQDDAFDDLLVWSDQNGDGLSAADEIYDLAILGIVGIQLEADATAVLDQGNLIGLQSSYATADGTMHDIVDVWFRTGEEVDIPPIALPSNDWLV